MARRQSLQRFMEKRRDRLASKDPYASAKSSDMEGASEGSLNSTKQLAVATYPSHCHEKLD